MRCHRGALIVSQGIPIARVTAHPNLQADLVFPFRLWFKSNGQAADYAQILSKRDGCTFSLFYSGRTGRSSCQIYI